MLVLKIQSQNGNLKDSKIKNISFLLLPFSKTGMDEQFENKNRTTESCLKQDKVIFTPNTAIDLFTVYELDIWSQELNAAFTIKDCSFVAVKLTKNTDPNICSYSECDVGFDSGSQFLVPNFD